LAGPATQSKFCPNTSMSPSNAGSVSRAIPRSWRVINELSKPSRPNAGACAPANSTGERHLKQGRPREHLLYYRAENSRRLFMGRGAKPGERRGGRLKGSRNKATIERALIAERVANEAKMAGKKLAKEVLDQFMVLFAGMAAYYQPKPVPGMQQNPN